MQPGGMGAGPRLTLEEVYDTFRVLNLGGMGITTVSLPLDLFLVSRCYVFRISGFGFRVSGFAFRVLRSGFEF